MFTDTSGSTRLARGHFTKGEFKVQRSPPTCDDVVSGPDVACRPQAQRRCCAFAIPAQRRTEAPVDFSQSARRLGISAAAGIAVLGLGYAVMLIVGLLLFPSPQQPIAGWY